MLTSLVLWISTAVAGPLEHALEASTALGVADADGVRGLLDPSLTDAHGVPLAEAWPLDPAYWRQAVRSAERCEPIRARVLSGRVVLRSRCGTQWLDETFAIEAGTARLTDVSEVDRTLAPAEAVRPRWTLLPGEDRPGDVEVAFDTWKPDHWASVDELHSLSAPVDAEHAQEVRASPCWPGDEWFIARVTNGVVRVETETRQRRSIHFSETQCMDGDVSDDLPGWATHDDTLSGWRGEEANRLRAEVLSAYAHTLQPWDPAGADGLRAVAARHGVDVGAALLRSEVGLKPGLWVARDVSPDGLRVPVRSSRRVPSQTVWRVDEAGRLIGMAPAPWIPVPQAAPRVLFDAGELLLPAGAVPRGMGGETYRHELPVSLLAEAYGSALGEGTELRPTTSAGFDILRDGEVLYSVTGGSVRVPASHGSAACRELLDGLRHILGDRPAEIVSAHHRDGKEACTLRSAGLDWTLSVRRGGGIGETAEGLDRTSWFARGHEYRTESAALAEAMAPITRGLELDASVKERFFVAINQRRLALVHDRLRLNELRRRRLPSTEAGLEVLYGDQPPVDLWGQPIQYASPGTDGASFDLWSLGPDGKTGGGDDIHLDR